MPDAVAAPPDGATIPISGAEGGFDSDVAIQIALGEHAMRRALADGILRAFVIGNAAVWLLIAVLMSADIVLIETGLEAPADRVIDRGVVKTLVAATAVQVGFVMAAIAGNLFPGDGRRRDD